MHPCVLNLDANKMINLYGDVGVNFLLIKQILMGQKIFAKLVKINFNWNDFALLWLTFTSTRTAVASLALAMFWPH